MLTFSTTTGHLAHDGRLVSVGYSGHGPGLNNPAKEQVHDIGPIPRGMYSIGKFFDDLGDKGPVVCHLVAFPKTETFGRDGFMIHGDNKAGDYTASHGCIILNRPAREYIARSGETELDVL